MKISASIEEAELDFNFDIPKNGNELWIGKAFENSNHFFIKFSRKDGVVSNLEIDDRITTDKEIILERIIEELKGYSDSIQMGFETESGSTESRAVEFVEITESMKPYDPELIRVRPLVLSAFQIHRDISKKKIDLNPDFQRNFVWDDTRKSRLIESMLLKIPLPAFYFSEDKKGNFQVVDGLQRLTVINQFLNNEFKLKNLEYLKDLEGKYYSVDEKKGIKEKHALYEPYDSRVEATQLNINVIEASSPLRVKYDIFFRINTGGRPLNNQEIRNCFATSSIRNLLKRIASSDSFKIATGGSISDTRMDAQEISLRFLGFYYFYGIYGGNINTFLDEVLERLSDSPDELLLEAEIALYKSLEAASHLFGEYAFRKCLPQHLESNARRQLINKAMFVAWTVILANVDLDKILNKPKNEFIHVLADALEKDELLLSSLTIGTSDRHRLEYVFYAFSNLLNQYIHE